MPYPLRNGWLMLLMLVCFVKPMHAQVIYDSNRQPAAHFENDRLIEHQSGAVFATVKGNLVFKGNSEQKNDILLLIRATDIFSRKKGGAILDNRYHVLFGIYDGHFTYRDKNVYDPAWIVGRYAMDDDTSFTLYRDTSDAVICRFSGQKITTGQLAAIFYFWAIRLQLDAGMEQMVAQLAATRSADITQTSGVISRLWNTGLDEFVWDGKVFKRKWNSFDYEEWTFDGTTLKRLWYPGEEEFLWDGRILKRKWFISEDEFEWDGTILRRRYGNTSEEYIIQGNVVKPYFKGGTDNEWIIEGQVPIPLIALVVFGLIRK
ncbi:MAG: hypothetical protein KatS3mg031_2181 [Chitinophagales bacterium]|nr:MAG: hypothetical protein KatS3mg031_2181 [Chitinophagales bacterium]